MQLLRHPTHLEGGWRVGVGAAVGAVRAAVGAAVVVMVVTVGAVGGVAAMAAAAAPVAVAVAVAVVRVSLVAAAVAALAGVVGGGGGGGSSGDCGGAAAMAVAAVGRQYFTCSIVGPSWCCCIPARAPPTHAWFRTSATVMRAAADLFSILESRSRHAGLKCSGILGCSMGQG